MSGRPTVLLGGVPFGRNNVGDEAILECVVGIVREACPQAAITVSTDDGPATARKLGVETVELFGFEPRFSRRRMARALATHDLFIWSGATGLSDYPDIPLEMLRVAQAAGRRTALFGVGMNDELNPFLYHLFDGRRRRALCAVTAASLGNFDGVKWYENRRIARTRRRIAERLARADLVVVRDPESRDQVLRCGPVAGILVGADAALRLTPAAWESVAWPDEVLRAFAPGARTIGICISAQREIAQRRELVAFLDRLVAAGDARIVFVPMNPLTDAGLMLELRRGMLRPERAAVLAGRYEPAALAALAARLDVVISSRLHLLIFATNAHTPVVGISRGSKVDWYLRPFGLRTAGNTELCDFDVAWTETQRLLAEKEAFAARSRQTRAQLRDRLDAAAARLGELLAVAGEGGA